MSLWEQTLDNTCIVWGHWSQREWDSLEVIKPSNVWTSPRVSWHPLQYSLQPSYLNMLLYLSMNDNNPSLCSPSFVLYCKSLNRRDVNKYFLKRMKVSFILYYDLKDRNELESFPFFLYLSNIKDSHVHCKIVIIMIFTLGNFLSWI